MCNAVLRGHSILVVDDEMIVHDLQSSLEQAGAETLIARSPTEALDRLELFDVTAAVLNYQPANNHGALAEALGGTPVLIYGSAPPPSDVGRPFIQKPARIEEIVAALARMLNGGKTRAV